MSAPSRVTKPLTGCGENWGSVLAASNHVKPAASKRCTEVATTWWAVGEPRKNASRLSIGESINEPIEAAARRVVLGLLLERDFDRDVTPEETTGDIARVTLFNAGLDFGDTRRQRVTLGETKPNDPGKDRAEQQFGHH